MRTFLLSWTLVALVGIACCSYFLATARGPTPASARPPPATPPLAPKSATADNGPRIKLTLSAVDAEFARAAEIVKADEVRLKKPGRQYSFIRSAEHGVLDKYQFIFDALPSLSPEVRRRMKELLRDREMVLLDSTAALIKNGIRPGSPEQSAFMDKMNGDFDAQLAVVCGPDFAEVQRLRGMAREVSYINHSIAPLLEYTGSQLTLDQKLQLAATMKDVRFESIYRDQVGQSVSPQTGLVPVYQELIGRAAAFLSPSQLAAIKAAQDHSIAIHREQAARDDERNKR